MKHYISNYLKDEPVLKNYSFLPLDLPPIRLKPESTIHFLKRYGFSSTVLESFPDHQTHKDIGMWSAQYSMRNVSENNYYDRDKNPRVFVGDKRDTFCDAVNPNLNWQWTDLSREHFPELIEWIETYLPFKKITDVPMVRNGNNLHAHIDQAYPAITAEQRKTWELIHSPYEPVHYRIVFDGRIEESTFVTNKYALDCPKIYLNMPEDTNSFCLGATNCYHGASKGDAKTLVAVFGFLDIERHSELIKRSLEKYSQYGVPTPLSNQNE
jgi:hypothetical protein